MKLSLSSTGRHIEPVVERQGCFVTAKCGPATVASVRMRRVIRLRKRAAVMGSWPSAGLLLVLLLLLLMHITQHCRIFRCFILAAMLSSIK